jgi:hypothetical protein
VKGRSKANGVDVKFGIKRVRGAPRGWGMGDILELLANIDSKSDR